jgi:hypothetical protein
VLVYRRANLRVSDIMVHNGIRVYLCRSHAHTHAQVRFETGYVRFTLLAVVNRLRRLAGTVDIA